jgi:virginiamycin B lyase
MRVPGVLTALMLVTFPVAFFPQTKADNMLTARQLPLTELQIVARVSLPKEPDWIALGFGSAWVVNYKPDRLSRVDPVTGHLLADIPLGPDACLGVVIALERVWVATCGDGVINEIDPSTNAVVRRISVPITTGREGAFAVADGSFWIPANRPDASSSAVARIDAQSGRVLHSIPVGARADVVIAGFGAVWAASSATDTVYRIDPFRNVVTARIAVGHTPKFMAAGEEAVWVQNQADGSVSRVDPRANRETARIEADAPTKWGDIATGDGAVWLSVNGKPVTRIDPRSNRVTHQFVGGDGADAIRYGAGALWVADHKHGELWKIDVRQLRGAP